ncbi:unnamed protein product [Cochlearia groenlandica]
MERGSLALFIIIFLFFPISSHSQNHNPPTSLLNQEQVHEVTIKYIKGGEEDNSIEIFRAGKGVHGVIGGKGGGRRASPKRNAAMDHQPPLFFSVLFTCLVMLSLTSFNMSIRLL